MNTENAHSAPPHKDYSWFPLDNAAKIFPAVRSRENTTVFRLSVILKERVKIRCLVDAIRKIESRFPYFKVSLNKGFFWYYLEQVDKPIVPVLDNLGLCRPFHETSANPFLFRVLVIRNRISIEFSHILTDGTGAEQFLRALLMAYFYETGLTNNQEGTLLDKPLQEEEYEDAYKRYFKQSIPPIVKYVKAFHLPFRLDKKPRFKVIFASLSISDILAEMRKREISITDYMVAVYLHVLQEIYFEQNRYSHARKRKILRIQVPVNLRRIYHSLTMRNFTLFVMPEIDLRLGHYSFEEILKIVHHRMILETDEKLINKIIARNVGSEKNYLVRGIPLFIKNLLLYYKYYSQGTDQFSGVITNMGKIEFPEEIMQMIDNFIIIAPPANRKLKINCAVVGFKDRLVISFGNTTRSNQLEMKFLRFLVSQGIGVKLINYT